MCARACVCVYIALLGRARARSMHIRTLPSRTSNRPHVQSCPPAFTDTTWGGGGGGGERGRGVVVFTDAGFSRVISKFRLSASRGGGGSAHTRLIYVNWR